MKQIRNMKQLQKLAKDLGVRKDWHEPDEQEVTVEVRGTEFDNAGFPAIPDVENRYFDDGMHFEQIAIVRQTGKPIAYINLATLFAFACGTWEGW